MKSVYSKSPSDEPKMYSELFTVIKENVEVMTELRKIVESMSVYITTLPNTILYAALKEKIDYIKEKLDSLDQYILKLGDIPKESNINILSTLSVCKKMEEVLLTITPAIQEQINIMKESINENVKVTNSIRAWLFLKLPTIFGIIMIFFFGISYFIQFESFHKRFEDIKQVVIVSGQRTIAMEQQWEDIKKQITLLSNRLTSSPQPTPVNPTTITIPVTPSTGP